ncbi:MAG: SDR family NAD(P)-dependent oxidoreductase [Propionicimonas sp.]|nr:SDR family NAD(P)-dependent oxidoreductase [Propionicimonas sp.]
MNRPAAPRLRTAVLTGATSGIGEATARGLAGRVDHLVLLGPEAAGAVTGVLEGIRAAGAARLTYLTADFTLLDEVVAVAGEVRELGERIDLLVNNAGVPGAARRILTADGFERTLQVNALAPALLTRLLVPVLADGARIVNVGSSAHRLGRFDASDPDLSEGYSPLAAYCRAKLAMVTWSVLLADELGPGATVVALCPGLNATGLSAAMNGPAGAPPSHGGARVLHAATADAPTGSYLEGDRVVDPSPEAADPSNRRSLVALYTARLAPFAARAGAR